MACQSLYLSCLEVCGRDEFQAREVLACNLASLPVSSFPCASGSSESISSHLRAKLDMPIISLKTCEQQFGEGDWGHIILYYYIIVGGINSSPCRVSLNAICPKREVIIGHSRSDLPNGTIAAATPSLAWS